MASEAASRSSSAADSYIGSLISLTSKSEIRYEGVLYNINTEESSIGLRNVRSFGTEGRKKDGPQVPPSDKIFEYILFRGSDIKDLQVKSSPPIQPTPPPINNDPAIIQSHYPRQVSTSISLPPAASGSFPDMSSHAVPLGLPGSNFQNGLPLYQPGGILGSWGASPSPPNANGGGLATPMYWQGYYGLPNGLPHMQQQSLLRPPPGLSMSSSLQQPMPSSMQQPMPSSLQQPMPSSLQQPMPSSLQQPMPSSLQQPMPSSLQQPMPSSLQQPMPSSLQQPMPSSLQQPMPSSLQQPMPSSLQQPMQYPTYNAPLPTGAPNFSEIPSSLLSSSTSSQRLSSASVSLAPFPSSLPPALPVSQASEILPNSLANKAANSSTPVAPLSANLTSLSPLTSLGPDIGLIIPPITNKPNPVSVPSVPYQSVSQPSSIKPDAPVPSLVTPGQLLQFGTTAASSSQSSQTSQKDVEVVQVSSLSSEPPAPVSTEAQPPILPLPIPAPSRAFQKPNGAPFQNSRNVYRSRERGRGTGSSRPVTKFTEDFDFEAMNEKFNKDEVWGHLGKGPKSPSKEREWEEKLSDEDDLQDEDESELSKSENKSLYNKDDFFDTLSCNALDNESHNGRTRYSQQVKIDTETFGDFMRYRGGRGGRGPGRGGCFRGGYYGRGYGYIGRGRGRSTPN